VIKTGAIRGKLEKSTRRKSDEVGEIFPDIDLV
jgi:hypothetical protein